MGSPPERREAKADMEAWSYLTDYDGEVMTTIVFRKGKVSAIKQTPWDTGNSDKS